ncbi:Glyoxalase/Bleomycin resistance protein/Dihydroxybiphenyl dioxygenase [Dactylonectria macrodidyma]|uniref:Glyoxalase/Bleomycin resistance protein/Dihydroxybiphenyl dioxygenase n=1 Tax=Dactylonectria macrodidyma TaxID=307937 RepID=A0A9P9D629_9HYPO|nr:Glyoxalase/Bleomycin resistance protein/Dihydroxybiphenyl dioxygenase [Dactylonectria macrodidyma]
MPPAPEVAPSFYVNIHTADPEAGATFFKSIGFKPVTEYSDDKTKAFRLPTPNDKVCLMLHGHSRFKEFMRPNTEVTNAHKSTEALFSFTAETKEEVDEWLAKADKAGGTSDPYTLEDYGAGCGMYSRSFTDLDGHIWEVVSMIGSCPGQKSEVA